jgi:hypothetical protein
MEARLQAITEKGSCNQGIHSVNDQLPDRGRSEQIQTISGT